MKFSCQACGSTAVPVTDCVSLQDPQYMQQALTNALLMDAAVGSLQNSKSIYAASKLAHFDRIKMEGVGTGFFFVVVRVEIQNSSVYQRLTGSGAQSLIGSPESCSLCEGR